MPLKPMNRAVHFDFHTMPGIHDFGAEYDAAEFAKILSDANVDYVNVFARCNIGFSYYPTKIGVTYPNMRGNMLGDTVRECHKRNIGVTAYLNTCLNHELMIKKSEWLLINKNGQMYNHSAGGNAFRLMCYNSGYQEYYLEEIREILELGVDGIFCDCYDIPPCYCQRCVEGMRKIGLDPNSDKDVATFSRRIQDEFMYRIRGAVPKDVRLFVNGSKQWHGKDVNTHFEVECLPSVWGYDYFAPNAAFARSIYDKVVYMNGRFQVCWGDFGGYKGKVALENDFYDALTQGAAVMMGDHLHPARLPDRDIYRDLGEIYGRIKEYEEWTLDARYIPEIAIITSNKYIGQGGYGAAQMLSELKYNYDIVWHESDFSKYKLLIIPHGVNFTDKSAEALRAYLKSGGKVISCGSSLVDTDNGKFILPEWSFEFISKNEKDPKITQAICDAAYTTYFKVLYPTSMADICYSQYETAIRMKAGEKNTTLAEEYDSYFDGPGYDGRHFIYYTPPYKSTGNSVIAVNEEGNVAHISFPIFAAYRKSASPVYKDSIKYLLTSFYPDNLIKAQTMPITSRITLTGNSEYTLLHVKVTYPEIRGKLGVVEEHNLLPEGRTLAVRGKYSSVKRLPDKTNIEFKFEDGYTYITLPEILGYDMFLLKNE